MGLNTTSGLSFGGGLSLGGGLSRGGGLVQSGSTPASVVAAYAAAVATNGGAVSAARQAILLTFFTDEFASGAYQLTDDYWGLWAEDAPGALTSLKQLRLATVTAAPTFTASAGYAFNGTTQCINTGFIPSTHGINLTTSSARIGVYERTNVSANTTAAGAINAGVANGLRIVPRTSGNMTVQAVAQVVTIALGTADSRGLIVGSRTGGTTVNAYQRGVALTPGTTGAVGNLPTVAIFLGADDSSGSVVNARACSLGFAVVGGALTGTAMELAQYNAVQTMATSIGANV